ncbi:hypothetical protein WS70_22635 [Burkholderia mayonis]|uniref:Uncharacterized protein n=1 Tax=Burkholderia mayonis TaxID=1385591 RepID=A0A1B4FLQ9_9BURK|nr:hypothetical protein WS70_22635 [Burkholderia mayonis]KVE34602.1 hypothetical protein WS69_17045 [Burkholderia sp. BDU5]KVE44627.1 hypothetical protein WS70_06390 [Burkholderia mayonis]
MDNFFLGIPIRERNRNAESAIEFVRIHFDPLHKFQHRTIATIAGLQFCYHVRATCLGGQRAWIGREYSLDMASDRVIAPARRIERPLPSGFIAKVPQLVDQPVPMSLVGMIGFNQPFAGIAGSDAGFEGLLQIWMAIEQCLQCTCAARTEPVDLNFGAPTIRLKPEPRHDSSPTIWTAVRMRFQTPLPNQAIGLLCSERRSLFDRVFGSARQI